MSALIVQYSEILVKSTNKPMISFTLPPNDIDDQFEINSIIEFEDLHSDIGLIKVEGEGNKIKANEEVRNYIANKTSKIFVLYRIYMSDKKELKALYLTSVLRRPKN